MLVLKRENGESISLFVEGQEVRIILLNSQDGQAMVGVEAPEETLILRSELLSAPPESFEFHATV